MSKEEEYLKSSHIYLQGLAQSIQLLHQNELDAMSLFVRWKMLMTFHAECDDVL